MAARAWTTGRQRCASSFADEPRLIIEPGRAARVAAMAEPVLAGARLSAGAGTHFRLRRLHGADHGRAAGRHHGDRGLRGRLARAVAGARRRRPDRRRLPAGNFVARHRPAAGAAFRFRPLCRPRRPGRNAGPDRRPQAISRRTASAPKANARAFAATRREQTSTPKFCCRSTT